MSAQEVSFDAKSVAHILQALNPEPKPLPPEDARITVHAAVSRISVLYEKLRNAVEYREEHLLRKGAIMRILRRQFVLERDPYLIAHNLVLELIGARYLPNETLPESLIEDVGMIIRKYQAIESADIGNERHRHWLLGVISAELEETVADPSVEKALVSFLYQKLSDRIAVRGIQMDDTERRLHIYVSCYRTCLKADEDQVAYKYVRAFVQEWMKPEAWIEDPERVAELLIGAHDRIDAIAKDKMTQRFLRAVRPWAVSLWMLRSAIDHEQERGELLSSRVETHSAIADVTAKHERDARGKIWRGTIRAMIYLLVTKIVFALALEVPAERFLYEEISQTALIVNISLPPVIMLLVGFFIRKPGSSNRKRILEHVDALLSAEGPSRFEIRYPRKRTGISAFMSGLFYLCMFVVSFGAVGYLLASYHFTVVAIAVFFFFLCVVSFFGYRLRSTAREIIVVKPRESLLSAVGDFLTIPILRAGRLMSNSISRINVFAFILDVVFEAPLKLFLGVLEDSLKFIREKKDELSE